MASSVYDGIYVRESVENTAKILVVGPFGVGKTTLIDAVSEIEPLRTEELMTQAGAAVDSLAGIHGKTTTTVALDFGRITLGDDVALYLFGTPGQSRFSPIWNELAQGAYGVIVLVDCRRLEASFEAMGLVERRGLPYVVALNVFSDSPEFPEEELREALDLAPDTPLVTCDARDRASVVHTLITLVKHLTRTQESV
ncbi:ATP/GTP-binding protein [Streptomyces sp. NPDC059743]|uniref:GTP-binding protein n=1 Tax=Streptomyces sp. NPDC059743 TaxID=3346928 RepID=UPI003667ACE8